MENGAESEPADRPVIGEWFANPQGLLFEVVAIDQDDGTVEVQYFDGTVEEFDADTWEEMRPKPADPPEDWSGSLDVEREDYGVDLESDNQGMWANPLDQFDR